MSSVEEIVESIDNMEDFENYRCYGESKCRKYSNEVGALISMENTRVQVHASQIRSAVRKHLEYLKRYVKVMELAFDKVMPHPLRSNLSDVEFSEDDDEEEERRQEINIIVNENVVREVVVHEIAMAEQNSEPVDADIDMAEVFDLNSQLPETYYESEEDDTISISSEESTISESIFNPIRVTRSMNRRMASATNEAIQFEDDSDADEAIAMNDHSIKSWFYDNVECSDVEVTAGPSDAGMCICADQLNGKRVVKMECNHIVCFDCMHELFYTMRAESRGRCPYCRRLINLNKCTPQNL